MSQVDLSLSQAVFVYVENVVLEKTLPNNMDYKANKSIHYAEELNLHYCRSSDIEKSPGKAIIKRLVQLVLWI